MVKNEISRENNPTLWALNKAFTVFDLEETIHLLDEDFPIRRIDEILSKAISEKAQELKTTEAALKMDLEQKLGNQNVRNWLTPGTKLRISREKAIKIAFALQMSYEETETFLKRCWLDGFYMRDVKDVIYRHGLKNGWEYIAAEEIIKIFSYLDTDNSDPEIDESLQEKLDAAQERLTEYLSSKTSFAVTKDELIEIIRQNEKFFGSFRRKTYERFKELYDKLKNELDSNANADNVFISSDSKNFEELSQKINAAITSCDYDSSDEGAGRVTTEEICDRIVKGIPEMRTRNPNEMIRTLITQNIPCRQDMSSTISKRNKVDRKLLMLVWLASEDGFIENFDTSNAEEDFMEHMLTVNDLLKAHGMAELDARHPFDWLVMNSLRCGYIKDDNKKNKWIDNIEERMQTMFENM